MPLTSGRVGPPSSATRGQSSNQALSGGAIMSRRHLSGFTLVELLVVIGIIAALISILLPALARVRESAKSAVCLSNVRQLQIAQTAYAASNRGYLVQAGMAEGGASGDESVGWYVSLQKYTSTNLIARCPSDDSPFWPGGETLGVVNLVNGVPQMVQKHRQSSYGINIFLDKDLCPWGPNQDPSAVPPGGLYVKITKVRNSSNVIQFLEMPRSGKFAVADHPHVENWATEPAWVAAADSLAINAHSKAPGWDAKATYGFLDGHAESLRFREVFKDFTHNKFDPAVAR
jgi:prepilin-type N-terminal cleavage/methylation domain-containing protein